MRNDPPLPAATKRFPIELFRKIRFRDGLYCPRCDHTRVQRWGYVGWRRRYRCLGCGRTFSDFTGTPLAYLKHVDLWPRFCRLVVRQVTVRGVAQALGIHTTTSFRWRHRLLGGLRRTERIALGGRVSMNATWFPLSEKGSRTLNRPPRRYRFEGLPFQGVGTWFILACDDTGRGLHARVGPRVPGIVDFREALEGRVNASSTVVASGGRAARILHAATDLSIPFEAEPPRWLARVDATMPESALDAALRLKRWLGDRFRGVATKYLEHYMVWFRLGDLVAGRWLHPPPLSRLLIGAFP